VREAKKSANTLARGKKGKKNDEKHAILSFASE
jgi:hypothetical protein